VRRELRAAALLGLALLPAQAHEIPADVAVHAFLKPEPGRLRLLVRVPLEAMRSDEIPLRGPGLLDLAKADPALRDAAMLWIGEPLELYEGERRLPEPRIAALRVSLPSDRSFGDYEQALQHVSAAPLPPDTFLFFNQGLLDVLFEYDIRSPASQFSIRPELQRLGTRVLTVLRFLPPGGAVRAFEFFADPGLVRLDPRWHQAAGHFVRLGFFHILDGVDHLLFLFCLVIPLRRLRALVLVVTSFTIAHSITLIASAYGLAPDALWFPPLVETLIAASIVYMALENIVAVGLQRRFLISFAFGLVHGFGFSFALRETLQFAGSHLVSSLLAFNVGVELGQLLVLVLLVPLLDAAFRRGVPERIGTVVLSALVAHTGWHWMLERFDALRQFRFERPALDALLLASGLRWLMLLLVGGALVYTALRFLREPRRTAAEE
jgi:HupE/UreJ protein